MLSNHPPQPGSERLPSWPPLLYWAQKHMKVYENQTASKKLLVSWGLLCYKAVVLGPVIHCELCGEGSHTKWIFLLPAAPAMCSSTLSSSSHAAGWMSPYISSVRTGAALIRSDKGAGERLITCEKTSHALQLSCVIAVNWQVVFYHICEFLKYFKIYFIFLYPQFDACVTMGSQRCRLRFNGATCLKDSFMGLPWEA